MLRAVTPLVLAGFLVISFNTAANADPDIAISESLAEDSENSEQLEESEPGVDAGAKAVKNGAIKKIVIKGAGNNPIGIFFKTLLAPKEAH